MTAALGRNQFFVKEHTGVFKAANNYDILDPESKQMILQCREDKLGLLTKIFRFTDYKRMTPFEVEIKTPDGKPVVTVSRGISLFLSDVKVHDGSGRHVGGFKQKFFSIGGKFDVLDPADQPLCTLQGNWRGWDFKFVTPSGEVIAEVSKKWAGLGKELFTSADNYMLTISDRVPADDPRRLLILGAVMCIDMVLKE